MVAPCNTEYIPLTVLELENDRESTRELEYSNIHFELLPEDNNTYENASLRISKPHNTASSTTKRKNDIVEPVRMTSIEGTDLEDELAVVVNLDDLGTLTATGIIKWMGKPDAQQDKVFVGVELDNRLPPYIENKNNIDYNFFPCEPNFAVYVTPQNCYKNPEFFDDLGATPLLSSTDSARNNIPKSPIIRETITPRQIYDCSQLNDICGIFKGIQGEHNSCYLDATLFAMFAFTYVFDHILYRPRGRNDLPFYEEIQSILRDEIVHPLRKSGFVQSERVTKLRQILNRVSGEGGYTTEEKDPEEFFNSIYNHIFKADPLLQLNTGEGIYFYQLFVDKDERISTPTVQQLFHQSLSSSDIKLKESPSCLIIQMPRFGRSFKMYPKIIPSIHLDITDVLENSSRICTICGQLARYECKECFEDNKSINLETSGFCEACYYRQHNENTTRVHHKKPKLIKTQGEFCDMTTSPVTRNVMELFAVICIETSHYVTFVKTASEASAPWCFFDSMADRQGEADGFNIPEMIAERNLSQLMIMDESDLDFDNLDEISVRANRLLSDAYICMYSDSTASMY